MTGKTRGRMSAQSAFGHRGVGRHDRDEYYCENCRAHAPDWRAIPHTRECPISDVRSAISAAEGKPLTALPGGRRMTGKTRGRMSAHERAIRDKLADALELRKRVTR